MQDPEMAYSYEEIRGKLGRYQILQQIEGAGLGKVWLGIDPRLQRQVIVKALPPRTQGEQVARFEHEVEAIAALNHPHILPIHDCGIESLHNGRLITYFVMPYIAGGSLAHLLAQEGPEAQKLTQQEALALLSQAAEALDYAHAQGVPHRNIQPANLLLPSRGWLLLADFSIAGTSGIAGIQANDKTLSIAPLDTTLFLSPEQRLGHPVPASDIYSLAAIASLLLTNQPIAKIQTKVHVSPDLPAACKEVLLCGMAEEPGARYPSATAFVEALQHSLAPTVPHLKGRMTRRTLLLGSAIAGTGAGLWALSSRLQPAQSSTAQIIDIDSPLLILREHQQPVQSLTWAPNSHVLVSASDAQIKLWDLARLQPQRSATFSSSLTTTWPGSDLLIAWSPDGTSLALASKEKTDTGNTSHITLLNTTLNATQSFVVPAPMVEGLVWQQQGFLVAAWNDPSQSGKPGYLGIWDTLQPDLKLQPIRMSHMFTTRSTHDPRRTLAATHDGTRMAICTTDGALIGSVTLSGKVVTWQAATPGLLQYQPNLKEVIALTWSANGRGIFSLLKNGGGLIGWSLKNNSIVPFQLDPPSTSIIFNAIALDPNVDQPILAASSTEGQVPLWNLDKSRVPIRTLKSGDVQGQVLALAWSFDGQWLAASYNDQKASILIWKL